MSHACVMLHHGTGRPTLKGIFDAAFIDARVDDAGDSVVRDDMTLVASADPRKEHQKVYAFCNTFNLNLVIVRAQVRNTPDSGGQWTVIFDYDRLIFEDERIETKAIGSSGRVPVAKRGAGGVPP